MLIYIVFLQLLLENDEHATLISAEAPQCVHE
jgi:hypothetical protein